MREMLLVARRDLAAYFNAYWGYVVIAAVLMIDGLLFHAFALGDQPKYSAQVIEDFFLFSFGLTCTASVFMTMRSLAEERQTGTLILIDASPLSDAQVVGGKYLAAWVVMAVLVLSTLYMPALVMVNGKVSLGQILTGYLGLLLVAAAACAIGVFASAVARTQLVAGVIAGILIVFFLVAWMLARVAEPPLKDIFAYLSFYERHYRSFGRGQIHTESIVYFVSVAFAFLVMATRFMSLRRWR